MKKSYKTLVILVTLITLQYFNLFGQKSEIEQYFPPINILESNSPAPGYFFIASQRLIDVSNSKYIAVIDNYGTPVFFRTIGIALGGIRYHENGKIAYMAGVPRKLFVLDSMLNVENKFTPVGYSIDPHGWDFDKNNHLVLLAKNIRTVNMSEFGGYPEASVTDLIIQEFDENNNLIFTWNSADYFQITDADDDSPFVDLTSEEIDYVHANSVSFDSDTSLLVSCRHMNEITKIDRRTGDIIWRLNGKNNDFTFLNDDLRFSHQHSITKLKNGNIMLFDNGVTHEDMISSAVEYELDEKNMTATLINRFRRTPDVFIAAQGFVQKLDNNTIAGWAQNYPSLTEFHPDGSVALELDWSEHSSSVTNGKYNWKTSIFKTDVDTIDFGMWSGTGTDEVIVNITNNTNEIFTITNYLTHTNYFSILTPLPISIDPLSSEQITIGFNPATFEHGYLKDIITICSDDLSQRIARQITLFGNKSDIDYSPIATISPNSIIVPIDTFITIEFNEPVRIDEFTELDYLNVKNYFILKEDNASGQDVSFNASINTDKMIIKLTPENNLNYSSKYYVSFDPNLVDYAGNQVIFSEATFDTEDEALITNSITKLNFKVYPNPTNDILYIENINTEVNIKLISILGKTVYEKINLFNQKASIDISTYTSGVYILQVKSASNNSVYTEKIIIE